MRICCVMELLKLCSLVAYRSYNSANLSGASRHVRWFSHLTQLLASVSSIEFSCCKSFRLYKIQFNTDLDYFYTCRGGSSTWKPQVTPVGPAPVNYSPVPNVKPVTKTSLAAKRQDVPPVSGHNFAPKPYSGPQVSSVTGDGVD